MRKIEAQRHTLAAVADVATASVPPPALVSSRLPPLIPLAMRSLSPLVASPATGCLPRVAR